MFLVGGEWGHGIMKKIIFPIGILSFINHNFCSPYDVQSEYFTLGPEGLGPMQGLGIKKKIEVHDDTERGGGISTYTGSQTSKLPESI